MRTATAWQRFRTHYEDTSITADDLFYYVYGVLHSPSYREQFASELRGSLARIPMLENFDAYSKAGRDLAKLHLEYESIEPYAVEEELMAPTMDPEALGKVLKMRFGKGGDRTTIVFNRHLTLKGIPVRAYEYEVNGRSAIEWLIDRYQVQTDKFSGIVNDPNAYSSDPLYIVDLVRRVITVSIETLDIVDRLRTIEAGEVELAS